MHKDPIISSTIIQELIGRLVKYYHAAGSELQFPFQSNTSNYSVFTNSLIALNIADILLRDFQFTLELTKRPLQIAIIGPTQTGKSTFINLLLGKNIAEVSPLAGFTKHPHAIAINGSSSKPNWLKPFFNGWECIEYKTASSGNHDYYFYSSTDSPDSLGIATNELVIWDTPDFDSLTAHSYQQGFLEAVAIADAIIVMLTPEKYSDKSAWDILQLLLPLKRPVLICLNKVTHESEKIIHTALLEKISELQSEGSQIAIVPFPKLPEIASIQNGYSTPPVVALQEQFKKLINRINRAQRLKGSLDFIDNHWPDWSLAITEEFEVSDTWYSLIESFTDDAMTLYNTSFLEHPQRFDTFKRALVELLYLLEIPILASTLTKFRQLITWPARQLFKGHKIFKRDKGDIIDVSGKKIDYEEKILIDVLARMYASLCRVVIDHCQESSNNYMWHVINKKLADNKNTFENDFKQAVHQYNDAFRPEIQAAANKLYEQLQKKPTLLNTLRAARVTADAAGIAFALKSGGLGLHDLFIAPAMVAFTSILTESALGSYMTVVASELRQRQLSSVRQKIFVNYTVPKLQILISDIDDPRVIGISRKDYAAANIALDALKNGS